MAQNVYECMFVLDTNKVSGDMQAAVQQLHTVLEKNQAEVLASRPWEERRLAYPVKGQKKGLYYLTYFSAEGKSLTGIEQDCKLSEIIMRQMVLKIDPKLVDTMLSIAKGEHAVALHNIHEEPEEGGPAAPSGGDDEGPRRSRAPKD